MPAQRKRNWTVQEFQQRIGQVAKVAGIGDHDIYTNRWQPAGQRLPLPSKAQDYCGFSFKRIGGHTFLSSIHARFSYSSSYNVKSYGPVHIVQPESPTLNSESKCWLNISLILIF